MTPPTKLYELYEHKDVFMNIRKNLMNIRMSDNIYVQPNCTGVVWHIYQKDVRLDYVFIIKIPH